MTELIEKGINMPEGTVVKLRPPLLRDGMTAAEKKAALLAILPPKCTFEEFTSPNSDAPVTLKIESIKGKQRYMLRKINFYFVARGKWDVLTSKEFGDKILAKKKEAETKKEEGSTLAAGFLTDKEMAARKLKIVTKKTWGDRYFYSTFTLFDMVEVRATRYAVLSQTADGVVVAGQIDPRFADDPKYPNQWRSIDKDALGNPVLGPKQRYSGTGFYVKVTRLDSPKDAIFFEFHSAHNEPYGWFNGAPTLLSKVGTATRFKVKDFRIKLARASQ